MNQTTQPQHAPDEVFLDPSTKEGWKVYFQGRVQSPDFNSKGAAQAFLSALTKGTRKPETR